MEDVITSGTLLSDVGRTSANVAGDREIDISDFSALLYYILDEDHI